MKKILLMLAIILVYGLVATNATPVVEKTDKSEVSLITGYDDHNDKKAESSKEKASKSEDKKQSDCCGGEKKSDCCDKGKEKAKDCSGKAAKAEGCAKKAKSSSCCGKH